MSRCLSYTPYCFKHFSVTSGICYQHSDLQTSYGRRGAGFLFWKPHKKSGQIFVDPSWEKLKMVSRLKESPSEVDKNVIRSRMMEAIGPGFLPHLCH